MQRPILTLLLAATLGLASLAQAQTLRWASQGDPLTMDPHSQNEGLTNSMNGQVYERLVMRDKQLGIAPSLATEWQQVSPLVWRFKLRPGVKFHDGSPFNADDVAFSVERAKSPSSQIAAYATACGTVKKIDDLTVEFHLPAVNPIFLQHLDTIFIMSKPWSEEVQGHQAAELQGQGRDPRLAECQRHRPLHVGEPPAGHQDCLQAQPRLVGQARGQCAGDRLQPDLQRCHAPGRADLRRDRFRARPRPARCGPPAQHRGREVIDGMENRVIYVGMDQARDSLLYGRA
jgi:peptide/nickel transport system substrate-binding protein